MKREERKLETDDVLLEGGPGENITVIEGRAGVPKSTSKYIL